GGFILALLLAWGIWWLLFRSTVGFEFRAVGSNPNAAAYAGMSVTLTTVLVMAIAGGLGGLAGANQTLGVLYSVSPGFTAGIGFDAIALDRKSTRLNSSHVKISYAGFCSKKKA